MKAKDLESKSQTLHEHLVDLRTCLINSLIYVALATLVCYAYSEVLFDFVRMPIQKYLPEGGLIYTGPMDKFIAHLKLSVICGVILACPFIFFQIWRFIAPGLYSNEKKYAFGFIGFGSLLFVTGCAFSYYIALPMAFEFLMGFGGSTDKAMISIEQYMGFFTQMCMMFGVSFELPLIIIVLGMMGFVSQDMLKKYRRYAVMLMAILAAVITPPDVISMTMMLAPLLFLYEISVIAVGIFEKKRIEERVNDRE